MESESSPAGGLATQTDLRRELIVVLIALAIFGISIISPPSLMDDVDSVQAQIARNMLQSGDWVTPHLDGIAYLEKSPLKYWLIAISYLIFGVHDWAARVPLALATVALCWVVTRFGSWAFGSQTGMYSGIILSTSVGLFLFTRILIPDVMLTLTITLAIWGLLRVLDPSEGAPARWALLMWAAMGTGLLVKGLVGVLFPAAASLVYIILTRQLLWKTWRRLRPLRGVLLLLAIAAPWHILATIKNPPYFDFTMHSESGSYHGFFWFYFINEHVLRFLNLRYPRDYNTVPRLYFWLLHLVWLFPWSVYFPATLKLMYSGPKRENRVRLMALCWVGIILLFFTFSTTQEYYSMPCYPALALLLGAAIQSSATQLGWGTKIIAAVTAAATVSILIILWSVRGISTPGDISAALSKNPQLYTLSLGHMADLTLSAFAYLRLPLVLAGVAFAAGTAGTIVSLRRRQGVPLIALSLMMILFFHAARLALIVFDPYLSSRPLAEVLLRQPPGRFIAGDEYYTFSSVFFYANRQGFLLNGRTNNLEYGSYAPGAANWVFLTDRSLAELWHRPERYYLLAAGSKVPQIRAILGQAGLHTIATSGGKFLFTNH